MDLQTAARRYEEMRHFWAREMAIKLVEGHCRRRISLLRSMQASAVPMSTKMLAATWPRGNPTVISHENSTSTVLTALSRAGMVKRGPRTDSIYWYALTELGELVCMYLPLDEESDATKNTRSPDDGEINNALPDDGVEIPHVVPAEGVEKKKRGRPRKTLVAALVAADAP